MKLNWRKPLFYLVLPVLVFLAFVGFPPPFPPPRPTRPGQTQGEEKDVKANAVAQKRRSTRREAKSESSAVAAGDARRIASTELPR